MKKSLLVALSLMLIFALVACGGGQVPVDEDDNTPTDNYRSMTIIRDVLNAEGNSLYMSFTTEFDNDVLDVEFYIKGENTRIDTNDPQYGKVSMISTEFADYYLMHDPKAYFKTTDLGDIDDVEFLYSDDDLDKYQVTTGQEELNGTLYDFEKLVEVDEDGVEDITIFYFVPDTDKWVALKSEGTMMYIHEISRDVDDSVFEVPTDYQEM